ncbi:MAG: hypothetical protein A2Z02_05115 [Chloroflexi bacterium RBG_16_48_7]|nr:MAG: hypothetical protein A2Z02_05115 [Chloroflexi bacterium RBG_16_48_7]
MLHDEEEHPAQPPPPPAIGVEIPEAAFFENEANLDSALLAACLHLGHSVSLDDSLIERNISNLLLQESQQYSYIGMVKNSLVSFC